MQRWYSKCFSRRWRVVSSMSLMADEKDHSSVEEPPSPPSRNPCNRLTNQLTRFLSADAGAVNRARDRKYWEGLSLEQKRKQYKCNDQYYTLSDILTWPDFVSKEPPPKKPAMCEEDVLYHLDHDLNSKVSLWRGDITVLEIDAIVNAANRTLMGGGGVDGAIHSAAGPSLSDECSALNGCDTGDAKITSGHKLPAKNIIHTVGPVYYGRSSQLESCASQLTSCYERSLQLALEHNIRSIAFPCISTGVYGFPSDRAAEIALETVRKWLSDKLDKIDRIIFCVFLQKDYSLYNNFLHKYFPLNLVAQVRNEVAEQPLESPPPPPIVPTLQKSVTEPVGMFHKQHETKVREIDDSKKEEKETLEDQGMDDNSDKKEEEKEEQKKVQEQEMSQKQEDTSQLLNQEEQMEEDERQ